MKKHFYSILLILSLLFISIIHVQAQPNKFFRNQPYLQYLKSLPPPPSGRIAPTKQLFTTKTHLDSAAFTPFAADFDGVLAGDAVWIDYDNDGDLDVMVSGWTGADVVTKIYRNDEGTFVDIHADIIQTGTEHGVAWGDFDNDGDFDLLITGGLDSTGLNPISKIFRNDNGTFFDIHALLMPLLGGVATWVDFDLDGKLDVLISGSPDKGNSFYTKLYRNDDSTFAETGIYFPGVWGASADWGDYDNDGDPDLLLTGYGNWGVTTALFRNDGSTFNYIPTPFQAVNASSVSWGDYDNDGLLDVLLAGDPPGWDHNTFVGIYHNQGNGTFSSVSTNLPPLGLSAVAWGDYDNDGDLDIAISGWFSDAQNITKIFRNDGGGVFTDINADLPGTFWSSLAWGDVDNDGRLDLLMTGATRPTAYNDMFYQVPGTFDHVQPITAIYHNNTASPNGRPTAPPNTAATVSDRSVEINWTKATDDHTPQHMLTYNLRVGTQPGMSDVVAPSSNVTTGYRRVPKTGNTNKIVTRKLSDLLPGMYYWSVQAIDNTYSGSQFATEQSFRVGSAPRWHLISLPFVYSDTRKTILYPEALSEAFDYDAGSGYRVQDVLQTGTGYWLEFPPTALPTISSVGSSMPTLSVPVLEGWNLIGSVDHSIPLPSNDLITSNFFEYNNGYQVATSIEPGKGYWVKTLGAGTIDLGASSSSAKSAVEILDRLNRISFTDHDGNAQQLYFGAQDRQNPSSSFFALPPTPPEGSFDARFASQQIAKFLDNNQSSGADILISSATYPVTIRWQIRQEVPACLLIDGKQISLAATGSVRIDGEGTRVRLLMNPLKETPRTFALHQNFPNPFNPVTDIRYDLPKPARVTLKVYDLLGQELQTLVDDVQDAGFRSVQWDGNHYASGVYLYKLSITDPSPSSGPGTVEVRKMILMK